MQSSGKKTQHMDIHYFFVTDKIVAEEVNVEYCPSCCQLLHQAAALETIQKVIVEHHSWD